MLTLTGMAIYEEEIKKSRFVAKALSVSSPEDTFAFLEKEKDPQATHNCWAFRINVNYRFSDDGEPKGTAGRPILTAIERQGLDHVMVIVTRYYGGIKLGAGGLTRAYGGLASTCLKNAEKHEKRPMAIASFTAGFDIVSHVYMLLKQQNVEKLSEAYSNDGVIIKIKLQKSDLPVLEKSLLDLSRGVIQLKCLSADPDD